MLITCNCCTCTARTPSRWGELHYEKYCMDWAPKSSAPPLQYCFVHSRQKSSTGSKCNNRRSTDESLVRNELGAGVLRPTSARVMPSDSRSGPFLKGHMLNYNSIPHQPNRDTALSRIGRAFLPFVPSAELLRAGESKRFASNIPWLHCVAAPRLKEPGHWDLRQRCIQIHPGFTKWWPHG